MSLISYQQNNAIEQPPKYIVLIDVNGRDTSLL